MNVTFHLSHITESQVWLFMLAQCYKLAREGRSGALLLGPHSKQKPYDDVLTQGRVLTKGVKKKKIPTIPDYSLDWRPWNIRHQQPQRSTAAVPLSPSTLSDRHVVTSRLPAGRRTSRLLISHANWLSAALPEPAAPLRLARRRDSNVLPGLIEARASESSINPHPSTPAEESGTRRLERLILFLK